MYLRITPRNDCLKLPGMLKLNYNPLSKDKKYHVNGPFYQFVMVII